MILTACNLPINITITQRNLDFLQNMVAPVNTKNQPGLWSGDKAVFPIVAAGGELVLQVALKKRGF